MPPRRSSSVPRLPDWTPGGLRMRIGSRSTPRPAPIDDRMENSGRRARLAAPLEHLRPCRVATTAAALSEERTLRYQRPAATTEHWKTSSNNSVRARLAEAHRPADRIPSPWYRTVAGGPATRDPPMTAAWYGTGCRWAAGAAAERRQSQRG
jgi:hypothetical protein